MTCLLPVGKGIGACAYLIANLALDFIGFHFTRLTFPELQYWQFTLERVPEVAK